ncbi:eukaryotic membrane protein family-domain-containing protein [Cryomyces antarcticus]
MDRLHTRDDSVNCTRETTNGQLITPALSPVSERSSNGEGYFPHLHNQLLDRSAETESAAEATGRQLENERNPEYSNGTLVGLGVSSVEVEETTERHEELPISGLDGSANSLLAYNAETYTIEERRKRSIGNLGSPISGSESNKALKLSPAKIQELTSSPSSLPLRAASPIPEEIPSLVESPLLGENVKVSGGRQRSTSAATKSPRNGTAESYASLDRRNSVRALERRNSPDLPSIKLTPGAVKPSRPPSSRAASSPVIRRKQSSLRSPGLSSDQSKAGRTVPTPLNLNDPKLNDGISSAGLKSPPLQEPIASPMPSSMPLPPMSISTYLQLELSFDRPSPLYIHRSVASDFPYESSKIKFERLLNFLLLPPQVEQILWFGSLACLDAWLYTFTILPLRFFKALWLLFQWWTLNLIKEAKDIVSFVCSGMSRVWQRRKLNADASASPMPSHDRSQSRRTSFTQAPLPNGPLLVGENGSIMHAFNEQERKRTKSHVFRHRRTKSTPSLLLPNHKADILKGLLVLASCVILMRFDASRMYHSIRGQAAIKLYVIYNVLEICDRLFSALGQDILECLFSKETLDRNPDGRSKIFRPLWMFTLALVYNVIHSTALFYQVITLNVAANSYSNALLTLLMSNQFVEIKGTVFKKFEKENLFQLTCADVVERFQLWLMLMIIALRNIVEVGGLSINLGGMAGLSSAASNLGDNITGLPLRTASIIPKSFTIFPKWTGQVLGPFLLVLGSEMLVDWLKHAYITKFNNTKPAIYGRFLDILAKDYYSNAFADQNLTKRLGLPVLPLSCLFIRASVQTYHMFLATHMPLPVPSTATSLVVESASAVTSPATTAALAHIDQIFRRALGRSSFGAGGAPSGSFDWWSLDDIIAFATMLVFFLIAYLVLLALKLVLGMCLLSFARSRYKGMKEREKHVVDTNGKRLGGWGVVEVDEDKRRWIYLGDPDGARALRGREEKNRERRRKCEVDLSGISRYNMAAKRIW